MNNYYFWNNYLKLLKKEIEKLCNEKDSLYIDLHIHSNYSSDGRQSIEEILTTTRSKDFDIISITDHDSLDVYDELYKILENGFTRPLIIPGIEFTLDDKNYGSHCHFLQLFVNVKEKNIMENVKTNSKAAFNRSKIQFKRLKHNLAISGIIKIHKINISYSDFIKYLSVNKMSPGYDSLALYLIEKFKAKKVTTFDILDLLEKYNAYDCYEDRKEKNTIKYKQLRCKYKCISENKFNADLLLSMLAVRDVDDDWWGQPASGSLSVNSYGQLKIKDLNDTFMTFFAHPTESSMEVVNNIIKENSKILGLELNARNKYYKIESFYKVIDDNKLYKIIGSDSHDSKLAFYHNMNFYKIDSFEFAKMLKNK